MPDAIIQCDFECKSLEFNGSGNRAIATGKCQSCQLHLDWVDGPFVRWPGAGPLRLHLCSTLHLQTFKPSDLQTFGAPHLGHFHFGQLAYQITWPSCVLSVKWLQQQRTPRIDDLTGLSGVERSLQLPFVQSFD